MTDRKELRRRIAARAAELEKALPRLDAAISTAAAALREAHEAEGQARRAHVAAQKSRRDYIRNRSEGDATDLAELRATADQAVREAIRGAKAQAATARAADNPVKLFAWTRCAEELEALLLEDDADMAARVSDVLSHVPQRIAWREAIGELLATRPRIAGSDDNLSPAGRAIEAALSELRRIDPLAKNAANKIGETMRSVRRYLQPQPQVARA